jgi:hypothetical protein
MGWLVGYVRQCRRQVARQQLCGAAVHCNGYWHQRQTPHQRVWRQPATTHAHPLPPACLPACLPARPACRYSGFRYGHPEGRILQFLLYARSSPDDNHYAHPLDTVIFYDYHTDK